MQFSINGSPQLTISHIVSCWSFSEFFRVASSRPLSIKADMTVAGAQEWITCIYLGSKISKINIFFYNVTDTSMDFQFYQPRRIPEVD